MAKKNNETVIQTVLFQDGSAKNKLRDIGAGLTLELIHGSSPAARLYRQGVLIKEVNLSDKPAKRLFIVETVAIGAMKGRLAAAFDISRQTIDNYIASKEQYGFEGLLHGYMPGRGKRKQRQEHKEERIKGNKAIELAKIRANKREKQEQEEPQQRQFSYHANPHAGVLTQSEQPFDKQHGWEITRYAGVFVYLVALITNWGWLKLITGHFGKSYRIFMVFMLMAARNIRSIEQLKHVRSKEAGLLLGLTRLPARPKIWEWFYEAANKQRSQWLLTDYFRLQIRSGIVSLWLWATDGHLLPYSGKEPVRHAYNTQKRMPVPGRTNMVTCDMSGRIVDFNIQEGKGDLREHIKAVALKWKEDLPEFPIMVFDREGDGAEFFSDLVREEIPFVTWEKNADMESLNKLATESFTEAFRFNDKEYRVFEGTKSYRFMPTADATPHEFNLRRIYILNLSSGRRVSGLAWSKNNDMSIVECAQAVLTRWGASENTFKHMKDRHPLHYQPGFKLEKSERQEIANPEKKEKEALIKAIKTRLNKLYKTLARTKDAINKGGQARLNSRRDKALKKIEQEETDLKQLSQEKAELPEKVDVSALADYKSFQRIDNEGKYLFDFVTTSVWNARKQMVEWLRPFFDAENELVDLFYAITACHGWIKNTATEVIVRLEPLQQPKYRKAQEQLCRKLTCLCARVPNGKWLIIEVGESPL